jgi:hypothetical protein
MSSADVEAKAFELMAPAIGGARAKGVIRQVAEIDAMADAGGLAALIAR